jgi:phosphoribosylformylglycinamidine cyclo-ligase
MTDLTSPEVGTSLSYRNAGVNIDLGNQLVERIKATVSRTYRPGVLAGLGGFGALFELPINRYRSPVLVSSTDGVGTKLKLAQASGQHRTVGIDLVAMCANDILVQGAEPLFFLDYFAAGKLNLEVATTVIEGIGQGCQQAGAALIGGETAEMPGMYQEDEYDLAGFCVGILEKDRLLDSRNVEVGHVLVGLASSGLHSNGYSLVRKILQTQQIDLTRPFGSATLEEILLKPTKIYVDTLIPLIQKDLIIALAHITGGGIVENLPRVIPKHCDASVATSRWTRPEIFCWIQDMGKVEEQEMLRTFNCGVGMVAIVADSNLEAVVGHCRAQGVAAWPIGEVVPGQGVCRITA